VPVVGWALGKWCVETAAEYFHIKFVVEDPAAVNASGPAIFALEPHDVLPLSIFSFGDYLKPLAGHSCIGCVTSACFKMPIIRYVIIRLSTYSNSGHHCHNLCCLHCSHLYTWFFTVSADKSNIEKYLRKGTSIVIVPGGVAEVTYLPQSKRNKECVLFLSQRLGFVKMALREKVPIIPVFCFGLDNTFTYWVPENAALQKLGR
jgi:hypothetical protein